MMHAPQHVSDAEDLRRKCTQQHAEFVREQAKNDALRAQLAALAEEHEVLTNHATIVEANLKALVEKVLAYEVAAAALTAAPLEACADAEADAEIAFHDAEFAMTDLARSLKP